MTSESAPSACAWQASRISGFAQPCRYIELFDPCAFAGATGAIFRRRQYAHPTRSAPAEHSTGIGPSRRRGSMARRRVNDLPKRPGQVHPDCSSCNEPSRRIHQSDGPFLIDGLQESSTPGCHPLLVLSGFVPVISICLSCSNITRQRNAARPAWRTVIKATAVMP